MEQQRRMENAMAQVEHYENQRELVPIMICILVGLAGAGVLALEEKFEEKDLDWRSIWRRRSESATTPPSWRSPGTISWEMRSNTRSREELSACRRAWKGNRRREFSDIGKGRDTVTRAVVCIRDTGCGMAPEAAQHMFDQFTRGILPMPPRGMDSGLPWWPESWNSAKGRFPWTQKRGRERPSRSDCRWSDGGVALCCQVECERGSGGKMAAGKAADREKDSRRTGRVKRNTDRKKEAAT